MSGVLGLWLLLPEPGGRIEELPEAEPLTGGPRGLGALKLNVFPKQHDRPCSCHGRALVWRKDPDRHDAWTGLCRRCGLARVDVRAGEALDLT